MKSNDKMDESCFVRLTIDYPNTRADWSSVMQPRITRWCVHGRLRSLCTSFAHWLVGRSLRSHFNKKNAPIALFFFQEGCKLRSSRTGFAFFFKIRILDPSSFALKSVNVVFWRVGSLQKCRNRITRATTKGRVADGGKRGIYNAYYGNQ